LEAQPALDFFRETNIEVTATVQPREPIDVRETVEPRILDGRGRLAANRVEEPQLIDAERILFATLGGQDADRRPREPRAGPRDHRHVPEQLAQTGASDERIQAEAANLGMIVPEPGSISYLRPKASDAASAAKRLASGQLTAGSSYAPAATSATPTDVPAP